MRKQLLRLIVSILMVAGFFGTATAQLKKTYYINSLSQLSRSDNFYGRGTNYTDWDAPYFGFRRTDQLPAGTSSPFGIMQPVTTLPVTWLDFSAKSQQNTVVLQWQTATEQNSKDFVIQHHAGNGIWRNIGTVVAAGTSDVIKRYAYTHHQPAAGNNLYRLVQRDLDGKESFSKIVSITMNEIAGRISVYPTLVSNGIIHVDLGSADNISVFNTSGSMMLSQKGGKGLNTLSVSHLNRGVYFLRVGNQTTRFIVQ